MATLNFDARQVAPSEALEPIPAGWYNAKIVESEMKPTKQGDGAYLSLTLQIIDGQYAGRKIFDLLNLQNPNPVAVEIAYKTLSAICHATGVIQCADSQQLHNLPLLVKISVRPPKDGYEAQNDVKGYKAIGSQPGVPAGPPSWQPPAGPPPGQWAPPPGATPSPAGPPPAWTPPAGPPGSPWPGATAAPTAGQPPAAAPATPPAAPIGQPPGAPTPPWAQHRQ